MSAQARHRAGYPDHDRSECTGRDCTGHDQRRALQHRRTKPVRRIVVTGFRAALQSATNTKKRTDQVVEAVNAEDIGKLPDNGIGESIARLPGISAQRNQGRANIISIRGFGPDFSLTTLNGREQTTTNDFRAVEFDQFPSEILNQVVVYKTPAANLTSQGLVGTIDLRTIRPLDAGKRIIAVGARGSYVDQKLQPDSRDFGYRVYGTYVDQFADGNVGLAAVGVLHERAVPDEGLERLGLRQLRRRQCRDERRQDVVGIRATCNVSD